MHGRRWKVAGCGFALSFVSFQAPASAQEPDSRARTGALTLSAIFTDGLVVQRGKPITVWGWAKARAPVAVSFHAQRAQTIADGTGAWRTTLRPEPAGGPFVLSVASGQERLERRDVLVGDVWLASGQ